MWLLMTVKKKKSGLFCSRMHAKSRFVSLFVHLWKHTVFLAKVRVEDITTVSSRGLMSLGTKGSLPSYKDQRIPCVVTQDSELLVASESMLQVYCLFRCSKDSTMLGMYPFWGDGKDLKSALFIALV